MLGCDVVSIARIEKILAKSKEHFLKRLFTDLELNTLKDNPNSIAGYYAAKEAASKALGCGISNECGFKDIFISKDEKGKPKINFSEKIIKDFNIKNAHLSISHDGGIAMAVVMLEKN